MRPIEGRPGYISSDGIVGNYTLFDGERVKVEFLEIDLTLVGENYCTPNGGGMAPVISAAGKIAKRGGLVFRAPYTTNERMYAREARLNLSPKEITEHGASAVAVRLHVVEGDLFVDGKPAAEHHQALRCSVELLGGTAWAYATPMEF